MSKSQEKRKAVQKKVPKVDLRSGEEVIIAGLQTQICDANARITILEERQQVIVDAYSFIADETRQTFGWAHLAAIFDAIHAKFSK